MAIILPLCFGAFQETQFVAVMPSVNGWSCPATELSPPLHYKVNSMFRKTCCLTLATLFLLSMSVAVASADEASDSFVKGNELLKQGEFKSALQAFAVAAKADRQNSDYMSRFTQTRQVIILQGRIEKEADPAKWLGIATVLHAFYLKNDIFPAALALDTQVHEKEKSATSGLMLAETQLAMEKNADAVQTLAGLSPEAKKSDWAIDALYAIALARDGKADEAKKAAQSITIPEDIKSGRAFLAAGVKAIEGDNEATLALLSKAFETTPPSRLDALKAEAKTCPELVSLASSDAFATALKTESKVPESSCSGGSSCATCPSRGKCGSGGGGSCPSSSTPQ